MIASARSPNRLTTRTGYRSIPRCRGLHPPSRNSLNSFHIVDVLSLDSVFPGRNIMPVETVSIAAEARKRFIRYAMSVVMGRALPDIRDGLKPVQRRILFGMYQ